MKLVFADARPGRRFERLFLAPSGTSLALLDRLGPKTPTTIILYRKDGEAWVRSEDVSLPERVLSLTFSPEGDRLFASTDDRLLKYSLRTRRIEEFRFPGAAGATELEWIAEDRIAASYPEVWPPVLFLSPFRTASSSSSPARKEIAKHLPRLAASRTRRWLGFCHAFEYVFLIDAESGATSPWGSAQSLTKEPVRTDRSWEGSHFARRIWFSADDAQLAVASQPRDRSEWDEMGICVGARDGSAKRLLRIASHMGTVEVAPDFSVVAAAVSGQPGLIALWDLRSGQRREEIRVGTATRDIRYSKDGRLLAVACEESLSIFER
jgi:WD40 repeat protein